MIAFSADLPGIAPHPPLAKYRTLSKLNMRTSILFAALFCDMTVATLSKLNQYATIDDWQVLSYNNSTALMLIDI